MEPPVVIDEIKPTAMYTAREVASWLRISNYKSIYDISEKELPRCKVGPSRGRIRYYGADLLCYIRGMEPINMQVIMDGLRDRLSKPGSSVTPIGRSGATRVL